MSDSWRKRLLKHPFFIRLLSWEYWPMNLVYMPVYLYWFYLGIKARAWMFFTAANPGIYLGGLFDDSKSDILHKFPQEFVPNTCYLAPGSNLEDALSAMAKANISFPIIAKPDKGERGFLVEKLDHTEALATYLASHHIELVLQTYIPYEDEVSVLYYRYPEEEQGEITSLTLKKFLSVIGDGRLTIRELIQAYPRALLQLETLESRDPELMKKVPSAGEKVELMPIGNHCRGTTFLNGNALIDRELLQVFDHLSHQLQGIYFGRFDIRCRSIEDLKAGQYFFILEMNGVKAEPTHIYQPGYPILQAYRDLFRQWNIIYRISQSNRKKGHQVIGIREGLKQIFRYKRYKKLHIKG